MNLVVSSFTRGTSATKENGRSLTLLYLLLIACNIHFQQHENSRGPSAMIGSATKKIYSSCLIVNGRAAASDTKSNIWRGAEEECWHATKSNYQRDANEVNKKEDHHQQARAREDRLFRRQRQQHTILYPGSYPGTWYTIEDIHLAQNPRNCKILLTAVRRHLWAETTKDDWSESAAMLIETRTYREINSSNDVPGTKNKMGSKAKTKTK